MSAPGGTVEAMDSADSSGAAPVLDPHQRAVVALPIDASGVVVGAPGSGKTTALIARVAALVEAGVDPDALLVLTPSRQTATALRDRLALAVARATSGPIAQVGRVVRLSARACDGRRLRRRAAPAADRRR